MEYMIYLIFGFIFLLLIMVIMYSVLNVKLIKMQLEYEQAINDLTKHIYNIESLYAASTNHSDESEEETDGQN